MDQDKIQEYNDKLKADSEKREHKQELKQTIDATKESANSIIKAVAGEAQRTRQTTQKVKNVDPIASPQDIDKVVKGLDKVASKISPTDFTDVISGLNEVASKIAELPKTLPSIEFPEPPESTSITNLAEIKPWLDAVAKAVGSIDVKPEITVQSPDISIPETKVNIDIDKIVKKLDELAKASKPIPQEKIDFSKLEKAMKAVKDTINGLSFPVPNYVLPFKGANGEATQIQLDNGALPITGSITAAASTLAEFQFNDSDDTTTASTEYFGYTKPDGTWLVKKLTDTTLRYATITNNGAVTTYASAWAAIASLTYGRMDEAF